MKTTGRLTSILGDQTRRRRRKIWINIVEDDIRVKGLAGEDANDGEKWRRLSWSLQGKLLLLQAKRPK